MRLGIHPHPSHEIVDLDPFQALHDVLDLDGLGPVEAVEQHPRHAVGRRWGVARRAAELGLVALDELLGHRRVGRVVEVGPALPMAPSAQVQLSLPGFWKLLFPDTDERGRQDETIFPYVIRHLTTAIDRSKQVKNWELLTKDEFERLLTYFNDTPSMQSFIILASDALGRPQELCWRKIKDIEIRNDGVLIHINDHGKEGTRTTWSYKALPYIMKWLEIHPDKFNKNAYFFLKKVTTRETWFA